MYISWDHVLQYFQMTSASLQISEQDLNSDCALNETQHYIYIYIYIYIYMQSTFSAIDNNFFFLISFDNYNNKNTSRSVTIVIYETRTIHSLVEF